MYKADIFKNMYGIREYIRLFPNMKGVIQCVMEY